MEVDDVIAHALYDPAARRQRYLKSRQLKGRGTRNINEFPKMGVGSRVVDSSAPGSGVHVQTDATAAARQAASNARQVAQIKGRLSSLKAHLSELLAKKKQAATSSSSSDSSKKSADSKDTKKGPDKPQTAKQKAAAKEALKKAQKERAKDQKAEPDKQTGGTSLSLDDQITKTRSVITDVETKLRAAVDSARTQTATNGR